MEANVIKRRIKFETKIHTNKRKHNKMHMLQSNSDGNTRKENYPNMY